jgi:hypothetical protein
VTLPAPISFLDNAADCIEAGDEIGRLVYLRAHAAKLTFEAPAAPVIFETRFAGHLSRAFPADRDGVCSVSGLKVWRNDEVRRIEGKGLILARVLREWDFRTGATVDENRSRFVRGLAIEPIEAALRAGALVEVMSNDFRKLCYKMEGETVTPCAIDGSRIWGSKGRTYKTIGAWWSVTASKAQALRIEVR